MADENQNGDIRASGIGLDHNEEESKDTSQFRLAISDLLLGIDQEAEQLRQSTADLLTQGGTLNEVIKSKQVLEALVVQLREANQHLVLAAFGAQDLQAKAESANHRQEEFLSMLAHELRNPLAPIAMAADLLGKISTAHPLIPKLYGIISRQVSHMTHLVDDLLDASRVSTGNITLQKRPRLLSEIIDSAIETSQPFINKRTQHLTIIQADDAIVIYGDLIRLAQAFANLLINATKFTPVDGHIEILVHRQAHTVKVSIKDDGVGISKDIQPFIFELFRQGPHSLDRSQGGLGIGLSLVRTIVEMHAGNVNVYSAGMGHGSEFIVELPISSELITGDLEVDTPVDPVNGCRILLIEDNVNANEILSDLLTMEGHTLTSAFDGTSGLEIALNNTYDVIICDIGLPGINGYEVLRQLRLHVEKPMPLCIAVSGYSQQENKINAANVGFDHYMVKPIAIDALTNLIAPRLSQ